MDLPDAALLHLQEEVNDYGRVLARAPVQISEASERPGGLLIKWAEVMLVFYLFPFVCGRKSYGVETRNSKQLKVITMYWR